MDPDSEFTYEKRMDEAEGLIDLGMYHDAADVLATIPPVACSRPRYLLACCLIFEWLGEWDDLLECADRGIREAIDWPMFRVLKASALQHLDRTEEAKDALYARAFENNKYWWTELARCQHRLGEIMSAKTCLRKAIALSPKDEEKIREVPEFAEVLDA